MSAQSFRPVIAVATCAFAALGCYLVSLRVATERSSVEDVETKIVLAQRDIRSLQTEIGTRGRLEQLERWNVKVLALSAPKADQFVDGGYQLARLAQPSVQVDVDAPVVMASVAEPKAPIADDDADVASTESSQAGLAPPRNDGPASILHVASFSPTVKSGEVQPKRSLTASPAAERSPQQTDLPAHHREAMASPHRDPGLTGSSRDADAH